MVALVVTNNPPFQQVLPKNCCLPPFPRPPRTSLSRIVKLYSPPSYFLALHFPPRPPSILLLGHFFMLGPAAVPSTASKPGRQGERNPFDRNL